MNQFLCGVARAVSESFSLSGPILEVGSYQVAGQESYGNLRELFRGQPYLGIDARPGPGVDQLADVEDLPQDNHSVGTVLAMNVFEHVRRFWKGLDEVQRVLRPDGVLLLSVPFYFYIHSYPCDYWRFTPEALNLLLEPFPTRITGWQGPKKRPLHVWALAFGPEHAPVTAGQFEAFRRRLAIHAREPLKFGRRCRYWLGQLLCGRSPLAPYLQRSDGDCVAIGLAEGAPSRPRLPVTPVRQVSLQGR